MTDWRQTKLGGVGNVFIDSPKIAAAGTGTSRTSILSTYRVPDKAQELIAVAPFWTQTAPVAAQAMMGIFDIIGPNFAFQPQQHFYPSGGSLLGGVNPAPTVPMNWYEVHAPVKGGESWDVGVTPLVANSGNMRASVNLLYSTQRSELVNTPIYSANAAVTAGKTAGNLAGASITIVNARKIIEIIAVAVQGTIVAADGPLSFSTTLTSTAFTPIQTLGPWFSEPSAAIQATSGQSQMASMFRVPVDIDVVGNQAVITSVYNIDQTLTNNASFAHILRYI